MTTRVNSFTANSRHDQVQVTDDVTEVTEVTEVTQGLTIAEFLEDSDGCQR